jgi:hypothetical protein
MPYSSPFPDYALILSTQSYQDWVPLSKAFEILHTLRLVYFPIQDSRTSGATFIDSINSSIRPLVFNTSNQTRFSDGYWVNLSNTVLSSIISLILTALQYKDRMFEKTNIGNTTVSQTSNTPQYLRAFDSFNNGLRLLNQALSDQTSVWDRSRFETEFALTWT